VSGFSALQQVFTTASQWIVGLEDLARVAIPQLAAMLKDHFHNRYRRGDACVMPV
jgi:hypothetical protein